MILQVPDDDEEFEEEEPMMDLEGLRKLNQNKVSYYSYSLFHYS